MGNNNKKSLSLSSFTVKRAGSNRMSNFTGAGATDQGMTFPDFSIMSCQQLEQEISKMQTEMTVIRNSEIVAAYESAIKTATGFYDSKGCQVNFPDTKEGPISNTDGILDNTIKTMVGTTDSGLPVKTTATGPLVPATVASSAKKMPWLLLAGVAIVAYVLFAGDKSSVG